MSAENIDFRRIMLKLSGEALGGDESVGIDPGTIDRISREIVDVVKSGVQIGIVMGAGNYFRGVKGIAGGMDRVAADQMGMVATLLNALALRDSLGRAGADAAVFSAIDIGSIGETYSPRRGREVLESGAVALCAGGTGNPYFTTDTAAALRALELDCGVLLKGTKVDGVYDKDPVKYPDAVRFDRITYKEVLERKLAVMDLTAVTLAERNNLDMVVFNIREDGVLGRVANGEIELGTLITSGR